MRSGNIVYSRIEHIHERFPERSVPGDIYDEIYSKGQVEHSLDHVVHHLQTPVLLVLMLDHLTSEYLEQCITQSVACYTECGL